MWIQFHDIIAKKNIEICVFKENITVTIIITITITITIKTNLHYRYDYITTKANKPPV